METREPTIAATMPVLEARGIAKAFGPVEVLTDISLTVILTRCMRSSAKMALVSRH